MLEELSKASTTSKFRILKIKDDYFLNFPEFESSKDAQEVFEKAKIFFPILSGSARLEFGKPLRFGNVYCIAADGSHKEYGFLWTNEFMAIPQFFLQASENETKIPNKTDNLEIWHETARIDKKVSEALSLFGCADLNWVILFEIYEIVEADIKTKIYKKKWVTKKEENRFAQTAQVYRHAQNSHKMQNYKMPKSPMNFYDALSFVNTVLNNWLRSRP